MATQPQSTTQPELPTGVAELQAAAESARTASKYEEAIALYTQALAAPVAASVEYDLLAGRGQAYRDNGDLAAAAADWEALARLADELDDAARQVQARNLQVETLASMGRAAEAQPLAEQALALARAAGDRKLEADSLEALGASYIFVSDYAHALTYYEEALGLYRELGDRAGQAQCLRRLGWVAAGTGDLERSMELQRAALALYREIGDVYGEGRTLNMLAIASTDYAEQRAYEEEALEIFRLSGRRDGQALMVGNLGIVYQALGLYTTARLYCERAVQMCRDMQASGYLCSNLISLAELAVYLGEYTLADKAQAEAYDMALTIGDQQLFAVHWLVTGRLALARGQARQAHEAFARSAKLTRELNTPAYLVINLALMGAASLAMGEVAAAQDETAQAIAQLEALGSITSDARPEEVWWWRYQALDAEDGGRRTDRSRRTEDGGLPTAGRRR